LNPKLAEVMADILEVQAGELSRETVRDGHPTWDSFNHLRLMTAIEEEFGVQFSMDEIESIETAGQLDDLLSGYLAAA
jgi:acyl carrier protein